MTREPTEAAPQNAGAVTLTAADGTGLAARVLAPDAPGPVTVISPATGVPARFYARFAEFLAASGRPVLLFDYRGQGASAPKSLVGYPARFRDWGILDIPAAIEWAKQTYPDRPLHWVGHSYGGFGTGLAHNNAHIHRLFAFASMTADVRFMSAWTRIMTGPQFLLAAMIARAFGYLPAGLVGSEPLPMHAMLEWRRFCTTKGFLFGIDDLPQKRHFASLRADVQLSFADDDDWMSRAGIEHLAFHMPAATTLSIWQIDAAEAAGRPLGHIGFFRSEHRDTLWPKALAWLEGRNTV